MKLQRQKGLSLIELLIAMTLGLTILAAAVQMLMASRNSSVVNNELSRMQENARFALDIITDDVRKAGFQMIGASPLQSFLDGPCGSWNPCTLNNSNGDSDRFAVIYEPHIDEPQTDCTGAEVDLNNEESKGMANVYFIEDGSLRCRGYNLDLSTWNGESVNLVDGIDNMQVLYGVVDEVGQWQNSTQYVTANEVDNWTTVNSLRVALLVNGGFASSSRSNEESQFAVFDSGELVFETGENRELYTATIYLENTDFDPKVSNLGPKEQDDEDSESEDD
ncbi:PilW family protein [Marinibactrum halimedae]|uniref:Prepilin-type N-terminal cleavage/methylation domain-containing protein n=1 Tax=Marinibactrum halimedae TaxID=1444977 RepID=A0AA37T624_9GAMM|nr:PilW family protein [Marinibactrum halimedae]MCD9459509.1 PilW family protein [Marinibactrum halimedae]GLS28163.1 hypothetical protein GCM10007877_38820 [Marinibactrum halimedae]